MTQNAADTNDPIAEGRNLWIESVKASDAIKIASIHCDDAIIMPPNETSLYGKGEVLEWWKEYFEYFKVTVLNGTERDVRTMGDQTIELWTYMIAIDPLGGGERIRDDGRSLTIWNSIRPVGSGTSRFLARLKKQ